jgi:hypothetical protein
MFNGCGVKRDLKPLASMDISENASKLMESRNLCGGEWVLVIVRQRIEARGIGLCA